MEPRLRQDFFFEKFYTDEFVDQTDGVSIYHKNFSNLAENFSRGKPQKLLSRQFAALREIWTEFELFQKTLKLVVQIIIKTLSISCFENDLKKFPDHIDTHLFSAQLPDGPVERIISFVIKTDLGFIKFINF